MDDGEGVLIRFFDDYFCDDGDDGGFGIDVISPRYRIDDDDAVEDGNGVRRPWRSSRRSTNATTKTAADTVLDVVGGLESIRIRYDVRTETSSVPPILIDPNDDRRCNPDW